MRDESKLEIEMKRREFLRMLSLTTLGIAGAGGVAALGPVGCDSGGVSSLPGGGSGPGPVAGTQQVNGTVNTREIGGQGLSITTLNQVNAPVGTNGSFNATVSAEGAQLILARDSSTRVRSLAISIPGAQPGSPLAVSAASTASALVFLTPGILSTDPTEASTRLAQIQSLPSYHTLLAAVTPVLAAGGVPGLLQNSAINTALRAVISDWVAAQHGASRTRDVTVVPISTASQFSVSVQNLALPAQTIMKLDNAAWRFVKVYRIDYQYDQKTFGPSSVAGSGALRLPISGAIPLSWGALFFNLTNGTPLFSPTSRTDTVDYSPETGATRSEYWVVGPGLAAAPPDLLQEAVKKSVSVSLAEPSAETVIYYAVVPFVELLAGARFFVPSVEMVVNQNAATQQGIGIGQALASGNSAAAILEAVGPVIVDFMSLVAKDVALSLLGAAAADIVGGVLAIGSSIMGSANLSLMLQNWLTLPQVAKIDIHTTGGTSFQVS